MLSIIIPVYNAEKYLSRSIESVFHQTFSDWELYLVDDGSTDGSLDICNYYAELNIKVHVIHQENKGVSSARNKGIVNAKGEFLMFLDADDFIGPTLCEKLMFSMNENDIAIGGYKEVRSNGERILVMPPSEISIENFSSVFDDLCSKVLINAPVSKIYRFELLKDLRFKEDVCLGEDLLFNLEYIGKCKKIALVDTYDYTYDCLNETSTTKRFREGDVYQIVELYKASKSFLNTVCNDSQTHLELEKQLCEKEINQIQLIVYSDYKGRDKKRLINMLFSSHEFMNACSYEYRFSLKMKIPQLLCLHKSCLGIMLFFKMKKVFSRISHSKKGRKKICHS